MVLSFLEKIMSRENSLRKSEMDPLGRYAAHYRAVSIGPSCQSRDYCVLQNFTALYCNHHRFYFGWDTPRYRVCDDHDERR